MPKLEGQRRLAVARTATRGAGDSPARSTRALEFTTYPTDPNTFFAPITSATGQIELGAFGNFGKCDLDRGWTPNAEKCPTILKWLDSVGTRFGKVQLLRMTPNTMRECRWGLHLDNNNNKNPKVNGWAVRVWLELTDDDSSRLVVRRDEFDKSTESRSRCRSTSSSWSTHSGSGTAASTPARIRATP